MLGVPPGKIKRLGDSQYTDRGDQAMNVAAVKSNMDASYVNAQEPKTSESFDAASQMISLPNLT